MMLICICWVYVGINILVRSLFYELTYLLLLFAADNNKDVRTTKEPLVNGVRESNNLVNGSCNGTEEVEKGETEASEKGGDKKDEPEVVFIQDMGFTVKIVSPGTEAFDIQVLEES